MTPRQQALAFRIWAYAEPLGWNCTAGDIADALGVTYQTVGHIARMKGWGGRFRTTERDGGDMHAHAENAGYSTVSAMAMAGIPARPEKAD